MGFPISIVSNIAIFLFVCCVFILIQMGQIPINCMCAYHYFGYAICQTNIQMLLIPWCQCVGRCCTATIILLFNYMIVLNFWHSKTSILLDKCATSYLQKLWNKISRATTHGIKWIASLETYPPPYYLHSGNWEPRSLYSKLYNLPQSFFTWVGIGRIGIRIYYLFYYFMSVGT